MLCLENEMFGEEEEQDPKDFEQPELGQGKCRHHLIILLLYSKYIYFHCMCLNTTNLKDLTSPILNSSSYLGVYIWVV